MSGTSRLADCPTLIDPVDIAPPSYFISHAWKSPLLKLIDTVLDFLRNASDDTAVWIDALAVNQHRDTCPTINAADVASFARTLHLCSAGTIVVADMSTCSPATRAWCLYEWDHTVFLHGLDGLHLVGLTSEDRGRIVQEIDIGQAVCYDPADLVMIHARVVEHHGSLAQFNAALKLQLLLNPLSYKVDREQLARRSEGTAWEFGRVQAWLTNTSQPRALCILAGAGTGNHFSCTTRCSP